MTVLKNAASALIRGRVVEIYYDASIAGDNDDNGIALRAFVVPGPDDSMPGPSFAQHVLSGDDEMEIATEAKNLGATDVIHRWMDGAEK